MDESPVVDTTAAPVSKNKGMIIGIIILVILIAGGLYYYSKNGGDAGVSGPSLMDKHH